MREIGEFVPACRDQSIEQFCAQFPHPFLMHATGRGQLQPSEHTQGVTIDRLVLGDPQSPGGAGGISMQSAYEVFEVKPRDGPDSRVSLGCSSTCDVQINDVSLSKLHAYIERDAESYFLRDNDSTAGSQVDSELLQSQGRAELSPGTSISLGNIDLTFIDAAGLFNFVRRFFQL